MSQPSVSLIRGSGNAGLDGFRPRPATRFKRAWSRAPRHLARILAALLALAAAPAPALDVVATAPSLGALARAVAGDRAQVKVLAPPDRDLHRLQAKPSMMRDLRAADLVLALGAELESGWLPVAISNAANPRILPGRPGYFEAAAQVDLLDAGGRADRSLGDVHPLGNPHLDLDPVRMSRVARALAQRLASIDPPGADAYHRGAKTFDAQVEERMADWSRRLAGAPGAVLYHRDAVYLLERFGVPLLGTIEPIPGVPPTGRQLRELANRLEGGKGIILFAPYQSPQAPRTLARELGWQARALPLEPPVNADGSGYLDHIGRWVDALAVAP
jgi:zinc/manganese transport system substrate-binding protein